jgi:hypothetical protein
MVKSYIGIEKGSGLRYPDPDMGYTPMGEVLRRYDFNEILWESGNAGGGYRGDGIVYVLANGDTKYPGRAFCMVGF